MFFFLIFPFQLNLYLVNSTKLRNLQRERKIIKRNTKMWLEWNNKYVYRFYWRFQENTTLDGLVPRPTVSARLSLVWTSE